MTKIDSKQLAINTIKILSAEAVEKARSGHPGAPMGLADVAFHIWTEALCYNPEDPTWPNRDRFVLSCGHASMLIYSLLHLAGFELSLEDLKQFRQWGSKTPGHPEFGLTPGVETTTGPLGQGISNAVGMALGAKIQGERFATSKFSPIDHKVYVLASDGDIMEGVQAEAASLAGHLGLDNLIVFYDSNQISIAGSTDLALSEDTGKRFAAYGWEVQEIDGHDGEQIGAALTKARKAKGKPQFIVTRTHIAHGSPNKQDTADSHGAPLGGEELDATKKNIGWDFKEAFHVPAEVRELFAQRAEENQKIHAAWTAGLEQWKEKNPEKAQLWDSFQDRKLPENLEQELLALAPEKPTATRSISGSMIQKIAELVPHMVGGSADLEPSNKSLIKNASSIAAGKFEGRNIHFGVREHAMGAMVNGMAYSRNLIPYGATFLVFADYMRPAIRVAALAELQSIFLFTHDSVFVGEDGPTHQPIEHLNALRTIPNCHVMRPADGVETAMAWSHALRRTDGPTCLALTRQNIPAIERDATCTPDLVKRGGYIVSEAKGKPQLVLIGTGSELHLCMEAKAILAGRNLDCRVVSMPCMELFADQEENYRNEVLPAGARFAVVEAGTTWGWYRWVGKDSLVIGRDTFGASAPASAIAENMGFTSAQVAEKILAWWG